MAQEHVGYTLIDGAGTELQIFGDTPGQCQAVPSMVILPNGSHVHCPVVGVDIGDGVVLVERMREVVAPAGSFTFRSVVFARPDIAALSLAVNLANSAIANGVQAGNFSWRPGGAPFSWPALNGTELPMDAPTLIEFADAVFSTI